MLNFTLAMKLILPSVVREGAKAGKACLEDRLRCGPTAHSEAARVRLYWNALVVDEFTQRSAVAALRVTI